MKTAAQLKTLEKARAVRLNQQAGVSIPVSTTNATPSTCVITTCLFYFVSRTQQIQPRKKFRLNRKRERNSKCKRKN